MPTRLEIKLQAIEKEIRQAGIDLAKLPANSPAVLVMTRQQRALLDLTEVIRGLMPEVNA